MTTPSIYTRDQLYQTRSFSVVRRAGLATDLPAAAFNIFNIANSPVDIYSLIGIVTTVIGAAAAKQRLQYTKTGGVLTPLCVAHATQANDIVGTIYYWSGLLGGALIDNAPVFGTSAEGYLDLTTTPWSGNFITLQPGIISVTNATAGTGIVDWYIRYLPLLSTGVITAL